MDVYDLMEGGSTFGVIPAHSPIRTLILRLTVPRPAARRACIALPMNRSILDCQLAQIDSLLHSSLHLHQKDRKTKGEKSTYIQITVLDAPN